MGMHNIDVHADSTANPEKGACANRAARRKKTFNMMNLANHAASLPRSESTDFNVSQHGAPSSGAKLRRERVEAVARDQRG
jgi:hypothetical protein